MSPIYQVLLNGLLSGAVYSLVAVGLSLVYGIMRVINLSHGSFYALGSFLAYTMYAAYGWSPLASLPLAAAAGFVLGLMVEGVLVAPVRGHETTVAIMTLGLAILMEQVLLLGWGPYYLSIPAGLPVVIRWGLSWNLNEVAAAGLALGATVLLFIFLKTREGLAMRLVARDEELASLVGINVERVQMMAFGLAVALATAAGALTASFHAIYPAMGRIPLLVSLAVVILGGLGNVHGAVLASLTLGVASSLVTFYGASGWSYVTSLALLIVLLLFRPAGLLGRVIARD